MFASPAADLHCYGNVQWGGMGNVFLATVTSDCAILYGRKVSQGNFANLPIALIDCQTIMSSSVHARIKLL